MTVPDRRAFLRRNPFPDRHTLGLFYREKMAALHALLPPREPGSVLEIGGGRSGLSRLCFPSAAIATVDLDRGELNALLACERRVQGDAVALPFADGSFDCVTLFDVVEHVPDDRAAAREAERVLAPGGVLLVSTPTNAFRYPHYRWTRRLLPTEDEVLREWGHVRRGYDLPDLVGLWPRLRLEASRHFQNRLTVLAHDITFAHWRWQRRRLVAAALLPLTWCGMLLQRADRGFMVAARLRKEAE